MNRIRMRHLRCFQAVARLSSVTRAAESLNTVQPSVSRSIKELEEEIGCALFERTPKGLVVNEHGRTLLSHISSGLIQIDQGILALTGRNVENRITVYATPNVIRQLMPLPLARFKELFPEVDVNLPTVRTSGLYEQMLDGMVDFGFGRLISPEQMKGMNFEYLYSEPLAFFVRPEHPLADRKDITIDEIDAFTVVAPQTGTIIRDELDRFSISKGISRFSNLVETISFEFSRNFIQVSDAIVVQPLGAMEPELDSGQVIRLHFARDELDGAVGFSTARGKPPSGAAQTLMNLIREEVEARGLS